MRYFGKVFVEFWDGQEWKLSAIPWYGYLYGRALGIIGGPESNKDYRYVPRNKIHFQV